MGTCFSSKLCFHLHTAWRSLSLGMLHLLGFVSLQVRFPGLARTLGEQGARVIFSVLYFFFFSCFFSLYRWGFAKTSVVPSLGEMGMKNENMSNYIERCS